jgi:hypothetical protein
MSESTVADTVEILSLSPSVIYGNTDDSKKKKSDVSLESIHDLLIQINFWLKSIEVNNVSLEKRLREIENNMSNFKSITESISSFDHRINNFDVQLKDVT